MASYSSSAGARLDWDGLPDLSRRGGIGLVHQPAVIHGKNPKRRSTAQDSGPSLKPEATRVSSQWSWIASRSVSRFPASVQTLGVRAFRELDRTFRHMR